MKFLAPPRKIVWLTIFLSLIFLFEDKPFAQPTQASFKGFQFAKFNDEWKVWDGMGFWDLMQHSLKLKFINQPDSNQIDSFCVQNHLTLTTSNFKGYFYFSIDTAYDLLTTLTTLDTNNNLSFLAPEIIPVPCANSNDSYYLSGPPVYGYQWYLDNINIDPAWTITHGSPNVTVAVIGDGIDWEHEDIGPGSGANSYHNLWNNPNDTWNNPWPFIPAPTAPGDGQDGADFNGSVDDFLGVNLHAGSPNSAMMKWQVAPSPFAHDHAMASIIGAKTNNGIGIAGIAGGWGSEGVRLMTISLFRDYQNLSGLSWVQYFANAINYAVQMGANIINISYGYPQGTGIFYEDIELAIDNALANNVLVVCSSGNFYCNEVFFPACYKNSIGIGGSNQSNEQWILNPNDGCTYAQQFHNGSHFGPELDLVAPSTEINACHFAFNTPTVHNLYKTWAGSGPLADGTSFSSAIVSGVSALMKSANPCLSVEDMLAILKGTADRDPNQIYDYYWDWTRPGHSQEMGYGRVNAGNAVTVAYDLYNASPDLYMRDLEDDYGAEPNQAIITNQEPVWISNDIWVRQSNDNGTEHQNPIENQVNYVYVKVRNRSCTPSASTGNDLKLYWTKANTSPVWPAAWDGSLDEADLFPGGNSSALMGGIIGTELINSIDGGAYSIIVFEWTPPLNSIYYSTATDWHYCLVARIVSSVDPMAQTETDNLYANVYQNNNIVLKNIEVLPFNAFPEPVKPEANVAVGNPHSTNSFSFSFSDYLGKYYSQVSKEAQVYVVLDSLICNRWISGGQQYNDIKIVDTCKIKIEGKEAEIKGIQLDSLEYGNIAVSFKFLVDSVDNQFKKYQFNLIQKEDSSGNIIGGETFEIIKNPRALFQANAGPDKIINEGDSVTLSATDVGEDAVYSWFNAQDQLLGKGLSITLGPATDQTYTLMVTANSDACTDYDEVNVHVATNLITSMNPNPAGASVKVYYETHAQVTVKLVIVNQFGSTMLEQNGNAGQADVNFNTTSLTNGNYGVLLLCNGVIMDYEVLIIQH